MIDTFRYVSYAQEVIFSPGSLATRTGEAVDRFGWKRLLVCANRSMREKGHLATLQTALGERLAAVFDQVDPHVQDVQVEQVLALAEQQAVDAIIGIGGGSPLGMAKAVAAALEEKRTGRPAKSTFPTDQPLVPLAAIPSTYAGSEMTPAVGITHTRETPPRKITVTDPKIAPRLVIYDPELTLDLPPEMTASTGINALAHCIEALYSITRYPLSSAAALSGIGHIFHALPQCYRNGNDLEARTEMLLGAHLAGVSLSSVSMGLHHGLCHVLGGSAAVPHGLANSIILPYAMRFNAEATAQELLPAAEAMGVSADGGSPAAVVVAAAGRVYDLVGQMGLPQRLRDVGIQEADLPGLARLGFQNHNVQNNPKPIQDAAEIENLLREAW